MERRPPDDRIGPLLRTRQTREFTKKPVDAADLDAIVDAARWSGSSRNSQPWRFIAIRDPATIRALGESDMPHTRALPTAAAAIAIVMPEQPGRGISHAYDEGRAAERILIAAAMLGLGAGIAWIGKEARPAVAELLGLPEDRFVRTVVAIGHPSEGGRQPKSERGKARLRRDQTVFAERWPG